MAALHACGLAFPSPAALADPPADKRVLLIGIDGCRPDAFDGATIAHTFHQLIKEGAFARQCDVLGDRSTGADTSTGPGWSSVFTGVWADKHHVRNNLFRKHNLKEYPTFLHHLKAARPKDQVVALISWQPFQQFLFADLDGCRLVCDGDARGYGEADRQVTAAAEKVLAEENPRVLFAYFGEVDMTGHGYGFHPKSPKYTAALEVVDAQVARILKALRSRPTYAKEDWLTIVCTDHGGKGREHGLGEKVPESRTGFLLLHGPSVPPGAVDRKVYNVDVAATALMHLGVPIASQWKLDGQAVGRQRGAGERPSSPGGAEARGAGPPGP